MTTHDIVAKLWNLCNILKDDGVTYHQYVTELTYLLFLKMAAETGREELLRLEKPTEDGRLEVVDGLCWAALENAKGLTRLRIYEDGLRDYAHFSKGIVREIYAKPSSLITKPATLDALVTEIDKLDWYSLGREGFGDIYEGLLEKNAGEKKSGAGQYFTPRVLIDSMVAVMKPALDDVIQDPAAGTAGFLIAANHYLRTHNDIDGLSVAQRRKYRGKTFYGMEHVQDTHRLALMNLMLHDIDSSSDGGGIRHGDTLSPAGRKLPKASLILTNPPFGTKKGGGLPDRDDFAFPTANKQFAFLQHIYLGLKPATDKRLGGRAAVVLPDNALFESNVGAGIRRDLMDKCNLHTILRLPTGIFYAPGVKTNVLFFARGKADTANTQEVWVYDLRASMAQFGKRTQLTREHFAEFEAVFGEDPWGRPESLARRVDTGEQGRFRRFTRAQIAARGDNLDIAWLKDDGATDIRNESGSAALAREAIAELEAALDDLRGLLIELGEEPGEIDEAVT